jgi:crotonobetainyl-CoA:carnitine CoA-transferase CaiB-like acyl-CoA transferase
MVFADHGADVVKVERPGGDLARHWAGFRMWNRGKRSVELDLRNSQSDRDALWSLLDGGDVLIQSIRPGGMDRLGFGPSEVRARAPHIVYCSINGFGSLTHLSGIPAYEGVVLAKVGKMVGLDRLSGAAAENDTARPLFSGAPIASYAAGQLAFQGVMAALLARQRTGLGDHVRTSLLQGISAAVMRLQFKREADDQGPPPGTTDADRHILLRGLMLTFLVAECKDGRFIQMCARQDAHFRNWLVALGLEDCLTEPRYAKAPMGFATVEDIEDLEDAIRARMRERTQDEWMDLFIKDYDIGGDPFLTFDEFLDHPQLTANDRVATVADDEVGDCRQLGSLALFQGKANKIAAGAPRLGSHEPRWASAKRPGFTGLLPAPSKTAPLDGVTVLELAYFLAAPLGPTLLAELGARVIKVEPREGDPYRRVGIEASHVLHGKESIALDLKDPRGQKIVHALIERSDALVHNFRPGVVERLGCNVEVAHQLNPDLVYLYGASYGSKGPESHRPAFHSTPTALSGAGIYQAGEGNAPVDDAFPDPCAGIAVASALLLGLWARERSGRGCYLETSMLTSAGYVHADNLVSYEGRPERLAPDQAQSGLHALYRLYPCRQGWVFAAVLRDDEWQSFAKHLGRGDLLADARFQSHASRIANDNELVAQISSTFSQRSAEEWESVFTSHGLGVVRADAGNIETFFAREGLVQPAHHTDGQYWRLGPRIEFDSRPNRLGGQDPIGGSSRLILKELTMTEDEIDDLCRSGVVLGAADRLP